MDVIFVNKKDREYVKSLSAICVALSLRGFACGQQINTYQSVGFVIGTNDCDKAVIMQALTRFRKTVLRIFG